MIFEVNGQDEQRTTDQLMQAILAASCEILAYESKTINEEVHEIEFYSYFPANVDIKKIIPYIPPPFNSISFINFFEIDQEITSLFTLFPKCITNLEISLTVVAPTFDAYDEMLPNLVGIEISYNQQNNWTVDELFKLTNSLPKKIQYFNLRGNQLANIINNEKLVEFLELLPKGCTINLEDNGFNQNIDIEKTRETFILNSKHLNIIIEKEIAEPIEAARKFALRCIFSAAGLRHKSIFSRTPSRNLLDLNTLKIIDDMSKNITTKI